MASKTELISEQLAIIAQHIPTIYVMVVVSIDGFKIADWSLRHKYPDIVNTELYEEEDRASAASASMFSLSERIISQLNGGNHKFAVINGDKGTVFLIALGEEHILTFGVREMRTIDTVLTILQQWWHPLLNLLDVREPEL